MVDWAALKEQARGVVHDTFAVPADYQDATMASPVALRVRYHNRIDRGGIGAGDGGYAAVLEGVNRLLFGRDELAAKGVTLQPNGIVRFAQYGLSFRLDTLDPKDGPVTVTWTVAAVD